MTRRRRRIAWFCAGLLLLAGTMCAVFGFTEPEVRACPGLYVYSQEQVMALCDAAGFQEWGRAAREVHLERDSAGTALLVRSLLTDDVLAIPLDGEIRRISAPSGATSWFIDDQFDTVAWMDPGNTAIHFGNGLVRELAVFDENGPDGGDARACFAPGAEYYCIETEMGRMRLASTRAPGTPLGETFLRASRMFYVKDRAYLFASERDEASGDATGIAGQVLARRNDSFELEREFSIARLRRRGDFIHVADMCPESGRLLLRDYTSDPHFFHLPLGLLLTCWPAAYNRLCPELWHIYELESGNVVKLGPASDFGLFLQGDILAAQRERLEREPPRPEPRRAGGI